MTLSINNFTHTISFRVNSVKNLGQVAVALGQERTRNELLPYILGKIDFTRELNLLLRTKC